jgi:hypothetical protein
LPFRDSDLAHLAANKLLEIDRGPDGSGSLVTLRFGSRANAIVTSYHRSNAPKPSKNETGTRLARPARNYGTSTQSKNSSG